MDQNVWTLLALLNKLVYLIKNRKKKGKRLAKKRSIQR